MRRPSFRLFLLLALASITVLAQDLPARTGRLAYVEGAVSIQQGVDAGPETAQVNRPIASGHAVFTEMNARAEVRVSGTSLRLGENTQLVFTRIEDEALEAMVAAGSITVRVRARGRAERQAIATPQAVFVIDAEGAYRIDYDPEKDESRLTVASGSAHMEGANVAVSAGKSLHLAGGTDPSYAVEAAAENDEFDQWSQSRDSTWREGATRTYVSPYMTGYEDLDASGQWATDPDYGPVWTPSNVEPSWAPYSDGRWANVPPWGWTWIDNAPWGYAPFHYGRWVYVRNRWGWCPGPRVGRPVYAPALVGWNGAPGPGSSGWYPLAPSDRLQPWYRASPAYVDRVNGTVRDRPPPRDWRGSAEGWRNWNRDHATSKPDRNAFVPRNPNPPARTRPIPPPRPPQAKPPQPRPPQAAQPAPPRPPVQAPPPRSEKSQEK